MFFLIMLCYGVVNSAEIYPWNTSVLNTPRFDYENCPFRGVACKKDRDIYCDIDMCSSLKNCTVKVAVILPASQEYIVNLHEAERVLRSALADARKLNILNENIELIFQAYDDNCTQEFATIRVMQAAADFCAHVIFGPICDYSLASVGRVAKYIGNFGTPVITPGGFSFDFTKKKTSCSDEFHMLINSGPADFASYAEFFHLIFDRYKWGKIALMYEKAEQNELSGADSCQLLMKSIVTEMRESPDLDFYDGDLQLTHMGYTEFLKNIVGVNYSIILLCTNQKNFRQIIIEAHELKMMELGEYIFFNFEMFNDAEIPTEPWFQANDTPENNEIAKAGYKSAYTFTPLSYTDFEDVGNQSNRGYIYLDGLYDGMMLYTQALNKSFTERNFLNDLSEEGVRGYEILKNMIGVTYPGKYGTERMNCNGQRISRFAMLNLNSSGKYEIVAKYDPSIKLITNWKVRWPSGDLFPPDTPKCGYDMSLCQEVDPLRTLAISLLSVSCIGIVLIGGIAYRHFKFKKEIYSMSWKITQDDFIFPQKLRFSMQSTFSTKQAYEGISLAGDHYASGDFVIYKSQKAYIKVFENVKIDLNKSLLEELKIMHDLSNENVVKFYGASLEDPTFQCLLYEYCSKGTLYDVIHDDNIRLLEMSFRISLLIDITRGMLYLHSSSLKSHGMLSSRTCLVDNRFSVKISDYGFRIDLSEDRDAKYQIHHRQWRGLLWTAPELLRDKSPPQRGTQCGDVYSFGIIMHEMFTRTETFYLGVEHSMTVREIVENVRGGYRNKLSGEPLRPFLEDLQSNDDASQLMRRCWNEDPANRPNFSSVKNKLKTMNKECDGNFVNNLLQRMEKYANNLEILVEEKTADYLEEKKRCEEVLHQLLPKCVAQKLILGLGVEAENFESVTIYFSDIVGFTTLATRSTPFELVEFLNDLYTCFDSIIENFDVYKVETIGDAYMVVSGLPVRNKNEHAREIARMALAMLAAAGDFRIRHRSNDKLELRIGLHSGPCAAGVVGLKMPRYCLFGDTVCTASRMESTGEASKIHVSRSTKTILDSFGSFELVCRGNVDVKGKGTMQTYWLLGEHSGSSEKIFEDTRTKDDSSSQIVRNHVIPEKVFVSENDEDSPLLAQYSSMQT